MIEKALRVAVVGGGVAGLAAAEELSAQGHIAEIFDARAELGGRVAPAMLGARQICLGGKNIGERYGRFRELLARRGHEHYEYFGPDSAQLVHGRVQALSFRSPSMRARLGVQVLARGELRSALRFLRLAGQVGKEHSRGFLGDQFFADLAAKLGDPTLPDYLGEALCRDVIRHMTVRMNGAEPHECHVGNLGSNLALVLDRFDQLTGDGLGPWIRGLGDLYTTHLATQVTGLAFSDGRVVGVHTGKGMEYLGFDGVVLATPAHDAARIVWGSEPELAGVLGTIRYFPVGVVVAEYDRPAFPEGFAGLSAPRGMALSNAGSYGLRDRHIVRFTFSGRPARACVQPDSFDPEALLSEGERFLAAHAPTGQARRLRFAARAFNPGLCAYRRDHGAFLHELESRLRALPGLGLAGDYLRGASLEACVRSGQQAVEHMTVAAGATSPNPSHIGARSLNRLEVSD